MALLVSPHHQRHHPGDAGIHSTEPYVFQCQLRWAGHVAHMPTSRISRKFFSRLCRAKRPTGAPKLTYCQTLLKALKWANIDAKRWHALARDRGSWQDTIDAVGRSSLVD